MKKTLSITALILALIMPVAASADDARLEFEARYWRPDFAGSARIGDGGSATEVDFNTDLGIVEDDIFEGRLIWRPGRKHRIRYDFAGLSFTGDKVIERSIEFAGETFDLSAQVASELELDYSRLSWTWQFIYTGDGKFRLGPLVEALRFDGQAALRTTVLIFPLEAIETVDETFGAVGLALDIVPNEQFRFSAEAAIITTTDYGDLTDFEASVRYSPTEYLGLLAGYRNLEIDARDEDDYLKLTIDGFFAGLAIRY